MGNGTSSQHTAWTRILALVSVCAVGVMHAEELRFQGQKLFGPETGFTILPNRERDHLTVSSMLHHYWLILPYSETWVFQTSRDLPLEAQDDQHVVTIKIVGKRASSDRSHLEEIASNLQASSRLEIRFLTYVEAHGRAVLRYQARMVVQDPKGGDTDWQWNYWTIARRKRDRFVLHISITAATSAGDSPDDKRLLSMLGAGFNADFEVK